MLEFIQRENYLNQLIVLRNTPDIKVVTGIRRSGKSVLIEQFSDWLKENETDVNLVLIKLQDLDYEELLEYKKLHQYAVDNYIEGKHNVLIIDEVQLCENFEKVINSLHSKRIYDIYITGSNAFLLSSDLATLFTGRTMEVKVFPFSFKEYISYYQPTDYIEEQFDRYVREGGMAGSYVYSSDKLKYDYIKDVYDTIMLKDLVKKYGIRNIEEANKISSYLMDNVSNILSSTSVCETLNRNGSTITNKTVDKYITLLCRAFLFYEAKAYNLKGKRYLEGKKKYYLCDTGIRYAVNGTRNMDFGRVYENIVFIELLRRGYDVYVGKLYQKEIDFVAQRGSEKLYIQVSDNISNPDTFEREYSPLLAIKDAYPKMILARTRHEDYDYQGIVIKNIANWLLEE
ncbi:MAG: ATP-binding protein [Erysipelotrichaceae bacterium]|nr:ATP-binding protein [Erysipelotrichaceae bacterium]